MADYATKKLSESKGSAGLSGQVVDSNIEGRAPEKETIRGGVKANKKSAGNVGSSNVNYV